VLGREVVGVPREGHVSLEDLNWEFGCSTDEGALHLFTEEENKFRVEFREFVKKDVLPVADRIDKERNFDLIHEAVRKMGRAGYIGVSFPREVGGWGKGLVYQVIIGEELSAASYAVAVTYGASAVLYAMPIVRFGTREQKEKFLKPIMKGEELGAIAITEPTGGSDAIGGMQTRAVKKGAYYVINGEKRFITNGSRANYILLYAVTNPDVKRHQGISAFIVPTDIEGFKAVKDYELLGRLGSVNSHLVFKDCKVPEDNLLGEENGGLKVLMEGLDSERTFTSSQYVGIARSAFEIATKYAAERVQFKRPIREFEGVSFKIADMYANIEAARLMVLRAARMIDSGLSATKEVAAAKFFSADMAVKVCLDAVQIAGGIGMTKEYPLERYLRDSKMGQIGAGTSEVLRYLVQREIYRKVVGG